MSDKLTSAVHQHSVSKTSSPNWRVRLLSFVVRSVDNKRYFILLAMLVGCTLFANMMADDYYLASRLQPDSILPNISDASIWNTFSVSDGKPETNQYLVQHGLMTWWTSPEFRFQMLRPISEISHWVDFKLWPKSLEIMHLHQMLWVVLFFFVSYKFLMKFSTRPEIGGLAFVIFSLSANHSQTIAWLASRNTLIAGAFGIGAILLHATSRERDDLRLRFLAIASFAAALLAGEFGLSASVWLFAWTLFLDKGGLFNKVIRLLPYGLIMFAWLAMYFLWHHGVFASEFYVNPAHYPTKYLVSLLEKTPTAFFNGMFHLPAAALFGSGLLWSAGWFASVIIVGLFLWLIHRRISEPLYKFYLAGSLLSMIPIAAGSSGARTLAFVSLGIVPIMANIVWEWAHGEPRDRVQKVLVSFFSWPVLVFTIISIGVLPAISVIYRNHNVDNYFGPAIDLSTTIGDSDTTVLLLNPNSVFYAMFYPLVWNIEGKEQPGSFYPLATSNKREMTFSRESENSFVLTPDKGFLIEPAAYFMRSRDEAFFEGERIVYPTISVTVLSVLDDGRPGSIEVRLNDSLDSDKVKVFYCRSREFLPLKVPPVGSDVRVPQCEE